VEAAEPSLRGGGIVIGTLSAGYRGYQGYKSGGLAAGIRASSFGAVDVVAETMMSSTGAGVAGAIAFDRIGGSESVWRGEVIRVKIDMCLAEQGIPIAIH
jgi:hypothetical protein